MAHELPQLPFPKDALAPTMSAETLDYHHGKHHAAYVTKLNAAIEGTELAELSIEELVQRPNLGKAVFNNGAQHFNHSFFWNCLSPTGGGAPSGALAQAIDAAFGSFDGFKKRFNEEATGHFGSGWCWLVKDAEGALKVISTHDADTPLAHGLTPLLTCDVWEHAYYVDYRNNRAAFVDGFWKLVNWDFVSKNA